MDKVISASIALHCGLMTIEEARDYAGLPELDTKRKHALISAIQWIRSTGTSVPLDIALHWPAPNYDK